MAGLKRTYIFAFQPDPEGGYVATCPRLPGLVTHGASLVEARDMARDAMQGYLEVLLEDGDPVPDSDQVPVAANRRTDSAETGPIVEPLTASIVVETAWRGCRA